MMILINLIGIVTLLPLVVIGLKESEVRESTCTQIDPHKDKEPANVDMTWVASVKQSYVPIWSKLHAYRITRDVLEKEMEEISEALLGKSCISFQNGNEVTAYGEKRNFDIKIDETSMMFKFPYEKALAGKYSFMLTDNASYILEICCWEDDQISWAVMSTTPTLKASAKTRIMDYIKTLGLKASMALEEDYGACKAPKNAQVMTGDKNEL